MNKINLDISNDFILDENFLEWLSLNGETEILLNFVSNFKSAKILRNFISALSDKLNIDSIWKSRLILIVDELSNNSIEYWSKTWETNCFKIKLNVSSNSIFLNCEVSDTGNWANPKKACDMYSLRDAKKQKWFANHNSIRGRGLFMIIDKLVDELYFKDSNLWWLMVGISKKLEIKTL